jgi:hypothetical protein
MHKVHLSEPEHMKQQLAITVIFWCFSFFSSFLPIFPSFSPHGWSFLPLCIEEQMLNPSLYSDGPSHLSLQL